MKEDEKNLGGVITKIIDLGLARLEDDKGRTYHTTFDPETFDGAGALLGFFLGRVGVGHLVSFAGDYQFDVYRLMRDHNGNEWETFRPLTNVMVGHALASIAPALHVANACCIRSGCTTSVLNC